LRKENRRKEKKKKKKKKRRKKKKKKKKTYPKRCRNPCEIRRRNCQKIIASTYTTTLLL